MKIRFTNIAISLLMASAIGAHGYDLSYYAGKSALSEGRWVKIRVGESGLYKIDRETLAEWGFNDPSRVTVYGYGGARLCGDTFSADLPDDVRPTATMRVGDGVIFYGEGIGRTQARALSTLDVSRNMYDRYGYYFVTEDGGADSYGTVMAGKSSASELDYHLSTMTIENDVNNPGEGGGVFHDAPMSPGETRVYSFEVSDFQPTPRLATYGRFEYRFAAHNSDATTTLTVAQPESVVDVYHRWGTASKVTTESRLYNVGEGYMRIAPVESGSFVGNTATLDFVIAADAETDADYIAVDRVSLTYPRLSRMAEHDFLSMHFPSGTQNFIIRESDADVYVWDVTDAAAVAPLAVVYDEAASITEIRNSAGASSARRYMAFRADGSFMKPEYAGEAANTNLHGMPVPEMVIVTTGEFEAAARELAAIHGRHGLDVAVAKQDDIYNEFSSGTRSAMGIRRFVKMLYDRGDGRLKHVLMYGPSHWDNRDGVAGGLEALPSYQTELENCAYDISTNYTADTYFVKLNDSYVSARQYYEPMDVNVGRIPVYSTSQASAINRKISRHLDNYSRSVAYGNVVLMSDDGEGGGHLKQSLEVLDLMRSANSSMTFTQVHNLIYPWQKKSAVAARAVMTSALRRGAGYVTFSGHSMRTMLTPENLWGVTQIEAVDYELSPLAMLATCSSFDFDRRSNSLADQMISKEKGGMIGVVTSCREVYMNYNQSLNLNMAGAYASADASMTIGDLFRKAYNATIDNASFGLAVNTMCYNLCGDPAVPVAAHSHTIEIDDVCGGASVVPAMGKLNISGDVTDGENVDKTFDGEVYVTVYDAPRTLYTVVKDRDPETKVQPVDHDEYILASGRGKVEGGHFDLSMVLPRPNRPGISNRIVVVASNDKGMSAMTSYDGLTVVAGDEELPGATDPTAPLITALYINDEEFVDGDVVDGSFTVYGEIMASESGLDIRSESIGGGVSLMLDGHRRLEGLTERLAAVKDGEPVEFSVEVSGIIDGRHTLTLTAFNNDGVSSSRSIDFVVVNEPLGAVLEVVSREVNEEAELVLVHDNDTEPVVRLVIEDVFGKAVKSVDNAVMPYRWPLDGEDGAKVKPGVYRARCYVSSDGKFGVSDSVEIVVLD